MTAGRLRALKSALFLLCLVPLGLLIARTVGLAGLGLGANPVEEILDTLGVWGLRLLLLTLAITPLRRLTGWNWLIRLRRMLGLFAFLYVCLHFLSYTLLDQALNLADITEDILERPFITLGMLALTLLLPLAVTSTNRMMRRLGRNWQRLHRLVYPAAILAVVHFFFMVKKDVSEPLLYAAILAVLLGFRLVAAWRKRQKLRAAVLQPSR